MKTNKNLIKNEHLSPEVLEALFRKVQSQPIQKVNKFLSKFVLLDEDDFHYIQALQRNCEILNRFTKSSVRMKIK